MNVGDTLPFVSEHTRVHATLCAPKNNGLITKRLIMCVYTGNVSGIGYNRNIQKEMRNK